MMKIPVMTKGLKARFFARTKEGLPPTPSVGDVVLIRSCKVSTIMIHSILIHPSLTLCPGHTTLRYTVDSRREEVDKHHYLPGSINTRARFYAIFSR
jgi:hypothetical protein